MKSKTILFFLLSTCMSLNASAQNSTSAIGGKAIFENNCVRCHGNDGAKGAFGAKNLRKSQMDHATLG
jgi:cytochrome c6